MQLGEAATAALIDDKHDDSCYFCSADKQPEDLVNGLTDDYDEDADIDGVTFKNDSGKLASNLGKSPGLKQIFLAKRRCNVSVAAHHLIPGNAALKKSDLFVSEEYLWTDGKAKGNIGYDVNSRPNGQWLPGNYAVRPWSTQDADFKQQYAYRAIDKWQMQFHDAHEKYSDEVRLALDQIYTKLEAGMDLWCPEAKKKKKRKAAERNPLYGLVARLHSVSDRLRRYLVYPVSNWRTNLWTSAHSLNYMNDY